MLMLKLIAMLELWQRIMLQLHVSSQITCPIVNLLTVLAGMHVDSQTSSLELIPHTVYHLVYYVDHGSGVDHCA